MRRKERTIDESNGWFFNVEKIQVQRTDVGSVRDEWLQSCSCCGLIGCYRRIMVARQEWEGISESRGKENAVNACYDLRDRES
jgi:hypothetical protein